MRRTDQRARVVPTTGDSLAQGAVVETSIVARLFGVPVLRLRGVILLRPGQLVDVVEADPGVVRGEVLPLVPRMSTVTVREPETEVATGGLSDIRDRLGHTAARQAHWR